MKKDTRQKMMAVSILLIMSLSSIAYVFYDIIGQPQQSKPLTSYVVDGEIDQQVEAVYVQNGWTFLKVYNNGTLGQDITSFIDGAPQTFTTSQDQTQLVVQKINSTRSYAVISNINGESTVYNMTVNDLYLGLCNNLVILPTACVLVGLNLSGF